MEASLDWGMWAMQFGNVERDVMAYRDPPPVTPTGFDALDAVLGGGLVPGIHVLMGQPGAGKSALALDMALRVALGRGRVLYVSAEMDRMQCLARLCSNLTAQGADGLEPVRWGRWESMGRMCPKGGEDAGTAALRALARLAPGLAVADGGAAVTAPGLASVTKAAAQAGADLIVVDYLQRIGWPPGTGPEDAYQAISKASESLAKTAKAARVPMLVLSSMNRASMKDGKPTLSGGRGSASIEYDAVTVMQLMAEGDTGGDGLRPVALHVLKNRRGRVTGDSPLHLVFDGAACRFGVGRMQYS